MLDLSTISLTSWAGIAATGALLSTGWRYVRLGLSWIGDLVICRIALKGDASRAITAYTWQQARPSPFGGRVFGGFSSFVAPKRRVEVIGYEGIISEYRLFWLNGSPLVIRVGYRGKEDDAIQMGSSGCSSDPPPAFVWFLRGTLDPDRLIEAAIEHYNLQRQQTAQLSDVPRPKRFNVIRMHGKAGEVPTAGYKVGIDSPTPLSSGHQNADDMVKALQRGEMRLLTWRPDDLIECSSDAAPFSNHPIAPSLQEQFAEIGPWLKHEQWFRQRGVSWYRGYLLYGPSGSGKSTVVRNLAIQHDLPIYTFDLSTYDNRGFADDWKTVLQNAPAIVLLEDLDCVYHLRENIAVKGKQRDGLTFDCLLNTLSGVGSSDGVLLFVTTNHLEAVDPALGIPDNGHGRSTRPGRINRAICVGAMGEPERRKLAQLILSDCPELVEPTVAAGHGEMAAQFQERCAQLALAQWNARHMPQSPPVGS